MAVTELRPYQAEAITNLRRSLMQGRRRPLLVSPTGSGKTHVAVEIIRNATAKGKNVLFLAPRRELIYQASERLAAHGVLHGIIMAGESRNIYAKCQVASMDTLYVRGVRDERMMMPDADVVIVDEAHLSVAPTRKQVLASYPNAIVVGLTATPARGDGKGLGEIYDDLVQSWSIRQLTEAGFLVPVRYFAPSKPDLAGLKLNKDGDYQEKALANRVDQPQLIGDIVHNWFRLARDKRTVVFCVTRAHSRHVCDEFKARGIRAEHLDGETPLETRKAILARVASGETQVLCNVFVATYGLDIPALECAVLARPTRNIALYLQTVGRVLRIADGKDEAIVIDHAGAVDEHGFVDDHIPWSLDTTESVKERKEREQKERGEAKEITCGECGTVFKRSRICPRCGFECVAPGKPIPVHQADLREVVRKDESAADKRNRTHTWDAKRWFYGELLTYCQDKGKNPGYAAHKYRARYGVWPNDKRLKDAPSRPVSDETLSWIRAQNIRYAKSVAKGRAA